MSTITKILAFLGPVAGAIKDHLNGGELLRVTVLALISGGGALGVLTAYQAHLGTIVDPTYAGVAAFILAFVIDAVRRLNQGTVVPTPAPGPVVNPDDGFPK